MKPRGFRGTFPLDAPVDRVWQALTDANRLTEWFATEATIALECGGDYAISWHGDWAWPLTVREVAPPRTLRLAAAAARPFDAHGRPLDREAAVELALEFHLEETAGGGTSLTIVHSGFGDSANWEDELDGVTLGWRVEAQVLGHYLRNHFGRRRHVAWARCPSDRPAADLWRLLMTSGGLVADAAALDAAPGAPVEVPFVTGDVVRGRLLLAIPGRHLLIEIVTPTDLCAGLLDLTVHRAAGRSLAQVVLSSWTERDNPVAALGARLQHALDRLDGDRS